MKTTLAILLNTLAIPGMGTLIQKRWVEGALQCALGLATLAGFVWLMAETAKDPLILNPHRLPDGIYQMPEALSGYLLPLFGMALANWAWSLKTSWPGKPAQETETTDDLAKEIQKEK